MMVIKHDGRREGFNLQKVHDAVLKAARSVYGEENVCNELLANKVTEEMYKKFNAVNKDVSVDTIHDSVEKSLMKHNKKCAKEYILYRQKRNEIRMAKSNLMKNVGALVAEMNHDNANTQNSAASKMYGIAESVSKPYFLSHMTPKYAENHKKGITYIHDLGYYGLTWNCFFNPLGDMLAHGFDNGVGSIRSPKRIASAVALSCIILQSSQNDMFGGQGFLRFDTDLAEYVKKEYEWQKKRIEDDMKIVSGGYVNREKAEELARKHTEEAVYQAMEAFVYNMNTMRSRSGAQVTFSSVNFGTDESKWAKEISKNLFKAYIAGLGDGENPIFPNLCYRFKKGINANPGDPNFDLTDLALDCIGKRIQPRFVFADSPAYKGMALDNIGTMGCRTAVRSNVNGSADTNGRGNLFFNTISLPYVALESKRRAKENGTDVMDEFKSYFHEVVSDAIGELLERYDVVKNLKVKDIPFVGQWWQGHEGLKPDDNVEPMVKNGSLSVGFLGLAECLTTLIGKHHGESDEAQKLGLEIVGYIRKTTDDATEKYHLNFATFASPAESACYTLLKKCRNEFGVVEGVTDKEYFTNGNHVPVSCHVDMKQKVDIEAPYHLLCNAGDIFYIEVGRSPKYNKKGLLKLLNYIADSGIVYGGVNWVMDFCNDCHYQGTFSDGKCPKCGSTNYKETKIITGYLSTEDHFNAGKVAESRDRISHAGGDAI